MQDEEGVADLSGEEDQVGILVREIPRVLRPQAAVSVGVAGEGGQTDLVGLAGLHDAGERVGQLRIEGRAIERLVLADESQATTEFPRPGASVPLPAGRYFVHEVELTNGFRCYAWIGGEEDWIQVPADPTPVVKVGAPLTPKVSVQRAGRLLKLDYELVDAAGRRYTPKDDAAALRACVKSPAAYVGMIGSRSKVGIIRGRFLAEGWASEAEFDRVRTPIGLPIGSKTVEEIAVSIAAELVLVRSRAAGPDDK